MTSSTRAGTRAARERQRRTGEPYSLAMRNARTESAATTREDSVPWHGVLAVLDERPDRHSDEPALRTPPGARARTGNMPLDLSIGREPGTDSPAAKGGLIAKVWIQPSPYSNQGNYLMGRGTARGELGRALRNGAGFPVSVDVDELVESDLRPGQAESWRLRGATVLIPRIHGLGHPSARIWYDPIPALKVPRTEPTAWPVRVPHVPLPEPGEDLAAWVARVGTQLRERRKAVTMNLLGLEANSSPIRRIKELAELP